MVYYQRVSVGSFFVKAIAELGKLLKLFEVRLQQKIRET